MCLCFQSPNIVISLYVCVQCYFAVALISTFTYTHHGLDKESEIEVTQSCPTLCNPMDCSLPGSSVHGIFQAIVLEWIAISFCRGSSWPRDQTRVSRIVDRCCTVWASRAVVASVLAQMVKHPPSMRKTGAWSLGWEERTPWEEMDTKSYVKLTSFEILNHRN